MASAQFTTWKLLMSGLDRVSVGNLKVAEVLHDFIVDEVLPGTGIDAAAFWQGLDRIVQRLRAAQPRTAPAARRIAGEDRRVVRSRRGQPSDVAAHKAFLAEIGYLVPEGPPFKVDTANVDPEIAAMSGRNSSCR